MKRFKRILSRSGFTLAETLLAVLILLLVSSIVATGIPVVRNVYEKVVVASNAQVLLSTTVTALRDELGTAWDVSYEGGYLTYFSADTGAKSKIYADGNGIVIQEYITTDGLNTQDNAIGDPRYLVSAKAATSDLWVSFGNVSCTGAIVSITGLAVYQKSDTAKSNPLAEMGTTDNVLEIRPFSVKNSAVTDDEGA